MSVFFFPPPTDSTSFLEKSFEEEIQNAVNLIQIIVLIYILVQVVACLLVDQ